MKKNTYIFLRAFLITGLTFGILMGIIDNYRKDEVDFLKLIVISILFGALMGWRTLKTTNRQKENH